MRKTWYLVSARRGRGCSVRANVVPLELMIADGVAYVFAPRERCERIADVSNVPGGRTARGFNGSLAAFGLSFKACAALIDRLIFGASATPMSMPVSTMTTSAADLANHEDNRQCTMWEPPNDTGVEHYIERQRRRNCLVSYLLCNFCTSQREIVESENNDRGRRSPAI